MRQRVITAVVALAIFIPLIYVGGLPLELAAAALAGVGVYELFRMRKLDIFSFEGILAIIGTIILVLPKKNWFFFLPANTDNFSIYYIIVMILLAVAVFSKNAYTLDEAGFPVIVSLYVGYGFQNFVAARTESLVVLFYALLVVWSTDIGAYMIGMRYGQNKLAPAISPNKSIEGSIGGVMSAVVVATIYLLCFPGKEFFPHSSFVMVLLTVVFSIVGQLGDLVESAYKRHYDVKDSGKILPGHGGILDRFDSLLFVFPMMHFLGIF